MFGRVVLVWGGVLELCILLLHLLLLLRQSVPYSSLEGSTSLPGKGTTLRGSLKGTYWVQG